MDYLVDNRQQFTADFVANASSSLDVPEEAVRVLDIVSSEMVIVDWLVEAQSVEEADEIARGMQLEPLEVFSGMAEAYGELSPP